MKNYDTEPSSHMRSACDEAYIYIYIYILYILWAMLGTHEVAQIVTWLVISGKSGFKWIHFYHSQLDTWQIMAKMVQDIMGNARNT